MASGDPAPQDTKYFDEGKYPFVRVQDLGRYGKNPHLVETTDYVNDLALSEKRLRIFPRGTILFPKSGVSTLLNHRALLGREACVVAHLAAVNANERTLLPKWLYYYLTTIDFSGWVSTTTLPSLPLSRIKALEVPIPPLDTQARIVQILEKTDQVRLKSGQARRASNRILQMIFLQMFGDPASNPRQWPTVVLNDVIQEGPQNGLYKPSSFYGSGVPVVRINSFYSGVLFTSELKRLRATQREIETYRLRAGDILVNRVNSPEFVGKCALVVDLKEDTVFESNIMRFRTNASKIVQQFVISFLLTDYAKSQILSMSKRAVHQVSINQQDVKRIQMYLPPIELQTKYERIVETLNVYKRSQARSTEKMTELSGSLMQRAFNGELTV